MASDEGYRAVNYGNYADHLIESMMEIGSAITIEVAGSKKPKCGKKSQQSMTARSCLLDLMQGFPAQIYTGFSHTNGNIGSDTGLDFIMKIDEFDESVMRDTFKEMLTSKHLKGAADRGIVDRVVDFGHDFSRSGLMKKYGKEARQLGLTEDSYPRSMSDIIGLATEIYQANLLEIAFGMATGRDIDIEHRFPYYTESHEDPERPTRQIGESDILIVASQEEIEKALKIMSENKDVFKSVLTLMNPGLNPGR